LPERYNRNSRLKGFPNVAEVLEPLTVRGAKAWTSEERRLAAYGVTDAAGLLRQSLLPRLLSHLFLVLHLKHKGYMSEIDLSLDDQPPSSAAEPRREVVAGPIDV
jgi:hypothetical protein